MNYYLGIDIGTTSAKAVAFSEKAEVLSSISYEYSMQHPQPESRDRRGASRYREVPGEVVGHFAF